MLQDARVQSQVVHLPLKPWAGGWRFQRRAGSAALDLAYVASGRVDGFWEFGINTWDIAAGCLIVQEAGGLVGDPQGGHTHLESGNIVAANPKLFRLMLQTLNAKS